MTNPNSTTGNNAEHSIVKELAGLIADAIDNSEAPVDTNNPNQIKAIWASAEAVAEWLETHDEKITTEALESYIASSESTESENWDDSF